jgi:hypothetical protein
MSLSDLSALGSFISGIAVVVSLVFLSLQIRQSNQNQRSLMQQGRANRRIDLLLRRADPYLSGIILRAAECDPTLEPAQIMSYSMVVMAVFEGYEDTFLQHQAGTMDIASWNTELVSMRSYFAAPSVRGIWRRFRDSFTDDFRILVDLQMKDVRAAKTGDLAAAWRAALAEESAGLCAGHDHDRVSAPSTRARPSAMRSASCAKQMRI